MKSLASRAIRAPLHARHSHPGGRANAVRTFTATVTGTGNGRARARARGQSTAQFGRRGLGTGKKLLADLLADDLLDRPVAALLREDQRLLDVEVAAVAGAVGAGHHHR